MKCLCDETSKEFSKMKRDKMNRERNKFLENRDNTNVIMFEF